jgi:oligopeptide transport system ATP-binding protein
LSCQAPSTGFQDPYASLNPRMTVGSIVGEALIIHKLAKSKKEREEKVAHLLETVGLHADHMRRYPQAHDGRPQSSSRGLARLYYRTTSVVQLARTKFQVSLGPTQPQR